MGDPRVAVDARLVPLATVSFLAIIAVLLFPLMATSVLTVAIWTLLLAEAGMVRVPAASGNRLSLLFVAGAAMPILLSGPASRTPDVAAVGFTYAVGLLLLAGFRMLRHDGVPQITADLLRWGVGLAAYLAVYTATVSVLTPELGVPWAVDPWNRLAAFAAAGTVWFVAEAGLWALMTVAQRGVSRRYLWLLGLGDWMVVLSMLTTGALFGFAWQEMGLWAILVAGLPYAFAHVAFFRYLEARRTYGQTIRALSRIPEVAGLALDGHSDRTADLAVEAAQELGMTPREVIEVRYAALMHDIGRITLNEPSILRRGFTDEDIARWGAEIVAESPYLDKVAGLVARQHEPYRRPGEQRDPSLPIASKIIKAASAYDHSTMELGFSPLEGLEVLHRGAAYDFDPDVVVAVRHVLERRGVV